MLQKRKPMKTEEEAWQEHVAKITARNEVARQKTEIKLALIKARAKALEELRELRRRLRENVK